MGTYSQLEDKYDELIQVLRETPVPAATPDFGPAFERIVIVEQMQTEWINIGLAVKYRNDMRSWLMTYDQQGRDKARTEKLAGPVPLPDKEQLLRVDRTTYTYWREEGDVPVVDQIELPAPYSQPDGRIVFGLTIPGWPKEAYQATSYDDHRVAIMTTVPPGTKTTRNGKEYVLISVGFFGRTLIWESA